MLKIIFENVLTIFLAVIAVFFLVHLVPGDPAQVMLGERATPEAIESIRKELGLDKPMLTQLGSFFVRLSEGDLGRSIRSGHRVIDEVKTRLPATIELSVLSLFIALVIGVLLGMLAAKKPGGLMDLFLGAFSVLGLSLPIFFLGLLLALVFGLWLDWLPLSGRLGYSVSYEPQTGFVLLDAILYGDWDLFKSGIEHLILPAFTLATVPMSMIARLTRASLIESLRADYVRTARAKGQSEWKIFFKHALRNAMLPVITMTGFQFGLLLGGAILTENVFAWPGMGRWLVFSVEGRDYPALQGAILVFATGIVIVMALTETIHHRADPRLKISS
ncbi:MAG: ABC-type transporter, integral rane subunit [Bacteriovoracaceae bacterium]|nr:ABC-type transporter, integral rane subunit [Bacteriovoracaceae bacterium]